MTEETKLEETNQLEFQQLKLQTIETANKLISESTTDDRDSIIDKTLIKQSSIDKMVEDYWVKTLDNAIKVCITLPFVIKTNKDVLNWLLEDLEGDTTDEQEKAIIESIAATNSQIQSYTQQIEAYKNNANTYNNILKQLTNI